MIMRTRLLMLSTIIFAIAIFRLLPHPPNVSPVAAMALFGGAYFTDKRLAFIVPFLALLLSDLIIGFHNTMIFVYVGFALTVCIGIWLQRNITVANVVISAVTASVLFFVITNLGAWMTWALYPMTMDGLMQAYVAGIPFFQNSLLGNLVFTGVLFGGYALVLSRYPRAVGV
jgi:hypothetical protein